MSSRVLRTRFRIFTKSAPGALLYAALASLKAQNITAKKLPTHALSGIIKLHPLPANRA
jgi:hypothetical protein